MEIVLYPTKVQGEEAAEEVPATSLKTERDDLDILIISRGGGSIGSLGL